MSDPFAFSRGSGGGAGQPAPWAPVPQAHAAPPPPFFTGGGMGGAPGLGAGAAAAPMGANVFAGVSQMASNPMAQYGISVGRTLVADNLARYMPGASAAYHALRVYFDVNNAYVVRKLRRLLFPFALRKWARLSLVEAVSQSRMGEAAAAAAAAAGPLALAPPVLDENAPDLYIPLMAFITFVLITGLVKGMLNAFHPDVLVAACSSMLALHALEVSILKAGLYALTSDVQCSLLDLAAFTGYKYLALCLTALCGIFFGRSGYLIALTYAGAASAFFLVNTLSPIVRGGGAGGMPGGGSVGGGHAGAVAHSQVTTFVLAAGALQVLLLWWMGQTPK